MEGECTEIKAVQGYYPPLLGFDIRLKNNTDFYWYVFSYVGLMRTYRKKVIIGRSEVVFERFEIPSKGERNISVIIELDYKKLDLIEEERRGDLLLELGIDLLGIKCEARPDGFELLSEAIGRGLYADKIWAKSPNYHCILVPHSKWVEILGKLDYGKFKFIELMVPSVPTGILDSAIESFEKAEIKLNEGDYAKVLVHCQDVIDKIGKAVKPFEFELKEQLGKNKFDRVGRFKGSLEHFLGLRHEVALEKEEPIVRKDAELALHTTLAFLNYYARRLAELKEK